MDHPAEQTVFLKQFTPEQEEVEKSRVSQLTPSAVGGGEQISMKTDAPSWTCQGRAEKKFFGNVKE